MSGRQMMESERTPGMVGRLWKRQVMLQKEVKMIDKAKTSVSNNISRDQRFVFKRFKKKLSQSKINHARMCGDVDTERDLRKASMSGGFNTNCGLEPEDEEVLQKIWNHDVPRRATQSAHGRPQTAASAQTISVRLPKDVSVSPHRPVTAAAKLCDVPAIVVTDCAPVTVTGSYICTSGDSNEADNSSDIVTGRPQTAPTSLMCAHTRHASPTPSSASRPSSRQNSIFTNNDNRPTLLDLHLHRIELARYESKVKALAANMAHFKVQAGYAIPDYYADCMRKDAAHARGTNFKRAEPFEVSPSDLRRYMGNFNVRSMTMKQVRGGLPPKDCNFSTMTRKPSATTSEKSEKMRNITIITASK